MSMSNNQDGLSLLTRTFDIIWHSGVRHQVAAAGKLLTILEERVDEGRDCGTRCKNDEAAQHNQAKDDRQKPKFLPFSHKRPKLD